MPARRSHQEPPRARVDAIFVESHLAVWAVSERRSLAEGLGHLRATRREGVDGRNASTSFSSSPDTSLANAVPGRSILEKPEWLSLAGSLRLSSRELEILQCIFDDQTEAAMALELGISTHTIHSHLERLYRKLGVTSRCGAVVRVFAEHVSQRSQQVGPRRSAKQTARPRG
jgi:DNA-binding CsgD family transcriptional regulator